MKPEITTQKDIRGRIVGYTATLATIETATHGTKADAVNACELDVRAAVDRLAQGTAIYRWEEHTYVVSPTVYGWCYWLDTFSSTYTCDGRYQTRDACKDAALAHLAANTWEHGCDDDAFLSTLPERLRADLRSRFTWYREHRRLTLAGYSDQDAREIIGGIRAESARA